MEYLLATFHFPYPTLKSGATMSSAFGEKPASGRLLPHGLLNLRDMINCYIASLSQLSSQLRLYQIVLGEQPGRVNGPNDPATDLMIENIHGWLGIAKTVASDFELDAVRDRIGIVENRLSKRRLTNAELSTEMRVLLETVDAGLRGHLIYRYPREQSKVLERWQEDWARVLDGFPSAQKDIQAGVDLWALQHHTASAFHFMRVLEHGLRALAKDVGISFDIQNWQNVIDEIEAEIRQISKRLPRGAEKNERLRFLSEAAKEFVYFKDGWRNYVAHNRANYDEYQSRGILEHVKAFMTTLSSKLREHVAEEKPC
jgi:hypothetical protein